MDQINFRDYCDSFLKGPGLGGLVFFKSRDQIFTYKDLIEKALFISHEMKNLPDIFFAIQIDSSYLAFAHILGSLFAGKKVVLISAKEPASSVEKYRETIPFTRVLKDFDLNSSEHDLLEDKNIPLKTTAFFILSSGSSGPSKGIPLTLSNVYHSAESVIDFFQMTSKDISFSNLPHHHIGGLIIFWRAFFSASMVTNDPSLHYQFISLVPLQLKRFLADFDLLQKLKNCKGVLIGGAPLSKSLRDEAISFNIPIFETYGMSETSSLVLLNGRPLKNQEVKLSPEGHFLIKGLTLSPFVTLDHEGFFHTKDIGHKNTDGSFSFKHRSDILFKSAGELIDPVQIEALVKELPFITDAAVVPVAHPDWTNASVLVYQTNSQKQSYETIKDHLKMNVHPHLVPRFFFKASDQLFKEGMKPKRFEIALWAQEHHLKNLFHYLYIPNENATKLVVFFHGFMEDHTDMIPLMDNHKENSYLFIDLPGHGKTAISNFKSRDSAFFEMTSLIKHFKKDKELIYYGYSMGGRIATELALYHLAPEKLILESTHLGLPDALSKKERLESDRKLFSVEFTDLKTFFTKWYQNPIFANYNKSSHFELDVEKKLSHNKNAWLSSLEFFSPGAFPYEASDVLKRLSDKKVFGIYGSEDHKYKSHFKQVAHNLKNMNLFEIEHAGHNPHKTHLPQIKKILNTLI